MLDDLFHCIAVVDAQCRIHHANNKTATKRLLLNKWTATCTSHPL